MREENAADVYIKKFPDSKIRFILPHLPLSPLMSPTSRAYCYKVYEELDLDDRHHLCSNLEEQGLIPYCKGLGPLDKGIRCFILSDCCGAARSSLERQLG